jgi:uncharacterized membrane protein (UPF0127 family)
MRRVQLSTADWSAGGYLAAGFVDRLLGIRRVPPGKAIVLPTRSVHSFGQRDPIEIVGLDGAMRVVATRTLKPRRIGVLPSARMIIELPAGSRVPSLSDLVEMSDV